MRQTPGPDYSPESDRLGAFIVIHALNLMDMLIQSELTLNKRTSNVFSRGSHKVTPGLLSRKSFGLNYFN